MHIRWHYTRFITQLHTICVSSNCKKTQFLLFLCCSSPWHKKAGHSSAFSISEIWSRRFVQCYWEVRVPPYFWIFSRNFYLNRTRETTKSFEYGKCLETGEMTKSLEYGKRLETGETTESLDIKKCLKTGETTNPLNMRSVVSPGSPLFFAELITC